MCLLKNIIQNISGLNIKRKKLSLNCVQNLLFCKFAFVKQDISIAYSSPFKDLVL